jgi:filamin
VAVINSLQQFRVNIDDICDEFDEIAVIIKTPLNESFLPHIIPTSGGFLVSYVPQQSGIYVISVMLNSIFIPDSPFHVFVPLQSKSDISLSSLSSLVRAFGPGLTRGTVNKVAQFLIDTKAAKHVGSLSVIIEGPSEARLDCRDNCDGTCSVAYLPTSIGNYVISITFDGQHIHSSPFVAKINANICIRFIRVYGLGVSFEGQ